MNPISINMTFIEDGYMTLSITEIDAKLESMREAYRTASSAQKQFMIAGAKLLKEHRQFLLSKNAEK